MRNAVRAAAALFATAGGIGGVGAAVAATTSSPAGAVVAPKVTLGAPVWTQAIPDGGIAGSGINRSSPTVATMTGGPAVVVGDRAGKVYAFHLADGSQVPGWPASAVNGGPVTSTPSAAPGGDVLFSAGADFAPTSGGYYAYTRTGAHYWFHQETNPTSDPTAHSGVQASMAIGNLQGGTDAVAGSLGQNLDAFTVGSGALLSGFQGNTAVAPPDPEGWFQADSNFSTAAIADLYGNSQNEIVVGGSTSTGIAYGTHYGNGGRLRVLSPTGNAGQPQPNGGLDCVYASSASINSSPAVGEFFGNSTVGIAFGTGTTFASATQNHVVALDSHCNFRWSTGLAGSTKSSPALADVMGNGQLQVVEATGTGTVYALTGATGHPLWQDNVGHSIIGSPVTADLTGGGYQDVLVATTLGAYVLDGKTGTVVDTLAHTYGFQNSPLVTKDPTGSLGITLAGADPSTSYIFHYRLAGSNGNVVNEAGAWPQFHHDPQLTGNAGTPPPVVQVTCKGKSPGKTGANGYYLSASDGGIFDFGNLPFCGSTGNLRLNKPVVGIAASPTANGYWEVASDGGLFAFGTVGFYGSMGGTPLNKPVVGMAVTPDGKGYWEVASDGGIFAFGDAGFYGSMGGTPLNQPVVGIAAAPTGNGYWEVASDGGIFAFGSAKFYGSMGGTPLNAPVVGIATAPTGNGYWEVASDGGIFAFGSAKFHGSMGGQHLNAPIVGMASNKRGGYWFVASDGGIFSFTATFHGSMGGTPLNKPVVGMAGF